MQSTKDYDDTTRGLNHAVTAALYLHKKDDDPYIKECLIKAAYYLKETQKHNPIPSPMLDVDFWLTSNDGVLEND